jgi:hypothetical protein
MSDLQEELSERLDQAQWHGHYFSAICVFPHDGHIEEHPSLLVYPDGFFCAGCNKRGSLKYLASQVERTSHTFIATKHTAPPVLPKWKSWAVRFGDMQGIAEAGHLATKAYPEYRLFFKKRAIDEKINQGMFGYIDGWALFPVLDESNEVVDIVARKVKGNQKAKYVIIGNKGGDPYLYVPNWKRVNESSHVYVVFGIIDSWSLELLSLPVITGTTGKAFPLNRLKPMGKKFTIVPDRYEEKEAYDLALHLGWKAKVLRLPYPEGCKDPDDVRMKFGQDTLKDMIGV